jgi:NitT/TauT family transport system ATP-binding protein
VSDRRTLLEARGVCKEIRAADGRVIEILRDFSLAIGTQEMVAIVGPSGAGKTTLLRVLSGLSAPTGGEVTFEGKPVRSVPSDLALVFQEYNKSLFPWLTLQRNVELAVRSSRDKRDRAAAALERVGLGGYGSRYPWEVSGGMQQRAALARAIVVQPKLLLMDEPFASVDALTRMQLEDMVLSLWQDIGCSGLLITHDVAEAVYMADRVLVVSPRPATVVDCIEVGISGVRDQVETKRLPQFQAAYARAFDRITGHVSA